MKLGLQILLLKPPQLSDMKLGLQTILMIEIMTYSRLNQNNLNLCKFVTCNKYGAALWALKVAQNYFRNFK